jgi:hypothetical protein
VNALRWSAAVLVAVLVTHSVVARLGSTDSEIAGTWHGTLQSTTGRLALDLSVKWSAGGQPAAP